MGGGVRTDCPNAGTMRGMPGVTCAKDGVTYVTERGCI